jgi:hypothetical protein
MRHSGGSRNPDETARSQKGDEATLAICVKFPTQSAARDDTSRPIFLPVAQPVGEPEVPSRGESCKRLGYAPARNLCRRFARIAPDVDSPGARKAGRHRVAQARRVTGKLLMVVGQQEVFCLVPDVIMS